MHRLHNLFGVVGTFQDPLEPGGSLQLQSRFEPAWLRWALYGQLGAFGGQPGACGRFLSEQAVQLGQFVALLCQLLRQGVCLEPNSSDPARCTSTLARGMQPLPFDRVDRGACWGVSVSKNTARSGTARREFVALRLEATQSTHTHSSSTHTQHGPIS